MENKIIYTLHKLPEGFIVTSNENILIGERYLDDSNSIRHSITSEGEYWKVRKNYKKVIAQQGQIDFSSLSEEEQKEIGWFDVEKLAKKSYERFTPMESKLSLDELIQRTGGYNIGFKEGFQKRQELLSDRKFTLEDMREAYNQGMKNLYVFLLGEVYERNFEVLIQSLPQHKWNVEIQHECEGVKREGESCNKNNNCTYPNCGKIKILKLL